MRSFSRARSLAALALTSGALAACATDVGVSEGDARRTTQAIINGTKSTAAQDYTVLVAFDDEAGKPSPLCTGTLIAKKLVLTARHCVGDFDEKTQTVTDYSPPSKLSVFAGVDAPSRVIKGTPDVRVADIIHAPGNEILPDIALVVLDKELSVPIAPIRLEGGAKLGEKISIIGYGVTQANTLPLHRQQRNALTIAKKGPGETTQSDLFDGEFQFGEGACIGDSGGPAISDETGALIGVATRVTNGLEPTEAAPSAFCVGPEAEDIYTDLTVAKALIESAFRRVGAKPWLEGGPPPEEQAATAASGKKATSDESTADGGCSISRTRASRGGAIVALASLLALVTRRRRPRSDR